MPKTNQLFHHAFTWFATLDSQPNLHAVLCKVAKKFVYQLEKCPTTGRLHFQGYLVLKRKRRSDLVLGAFLSGLGLKGITCSPASNEGKSALSEYCMKKDTRVAGPWADHKIYLGQDLIVDLLPWQKRIRDLSQMEFYDRHIHWYYDPIGGRGKSSLAKYMYYHHKILTLTIGKCSDILNLVSKFQNRPMYMFDIARSVPSSAMTEIYTAIEYVKSGYFINTKYDTCPVIMDTPHVIVFSNHLPKMSALSQDRWKIHDMTKLPSDNNLTHAHKTELWKRNAFTESLRQKSQKDLMSD